MFQSDPLKFIITTYEPDTVEWIEAPEFPHDVGKAGSRRMPFTREVWIERSDFMEEPVRKFRRLSPGSEVRLRHAYVVRCEEVIKDPVTGEILELRCSHDPATLGANPADGRKIRSTIHWVSESMGVPCEVRLYDRLFAVEDPNVVPEGGSFTDNLNPDSRVVVGRAWVEPAVLEDPSGTHYQFERTGYFIADSEDSGPSGLVFNRTVALRDSWAKLAKR